MKIMAAERTGRIKKQTRAAWWDPYVSKERARGRGPRAEAIAEMLMAVPAIAPWCLRPKKFTQTTAPVLRRIPPLIPSSME